VRWPILAAPGGIKAAHALIVAEHHAELGIPGMHETSRLDRRRDRLADQPIARHQSVPCPTLADHIAMDGAPHQTDPVFDSYARTILATSSWRTTAAEENRQMAISGMSCNRLIASTSPER